jgi:glutaredoxin
LYGAEWCKPCKYAREHLIRRGVTVVERDIEDDAVKVAALATFHKREIPAMDICGDHLLGYSADQIDDALIRPR